MAFVTWRAMQMGPRLERSISDFLYARFIITHFAMQGPTVRAQAPSGTCAPAQQHQPLALARPAPERI